ncbi:MAG: hypothetical protein BJ554DRAFT_3159, partial [Olpidium bornovanus]
LSSTCRSLFDLTHHPSFFDHDNVADWRIGLLSRRRPCPVTLGVRSRDRPFFYFTTRSEAWVCPVCGSKNGEALPDPKEGEVPPPVTAAEEDERQAPVQIPGLSFAYEGDEAVPRPSSSSSAAPEKSGTESACPGSGSSDPAQGGDEAAACAGRPQPGGRIPGGGCNPEAAAAEADDRRQFDAGRSASPASAAAGEVRPPGGTNPARSQPEQPPDGEAVIRARPFERRTGLRNLHSWALDLVIAVLVCIIAERLARKFYIL